ncbi:hypothetical protein CVT25_000578 [Psilocybe cyanescens]|uniref:Uncharacterized protein n=1 Tax=Psilocybe cyanescens TaxID=93625 RepID=A0A409WZY0_PSICY|nr:hypothetical protein CVT25_000578 [Psilocybe cyanescens]
MKELKLGQSIASPSPDIPKCVIPPPRFDDAGWKPISDEHPGFLELNGGVEWNEEKEMMQRRDDERC